MAILENEVGSRTSSALSQADAESFGTLTFITTEGEHIVFEGMDIPVEEAAALMGEEALAKIWNRPAEDAAWRDIQKAI